MLQLPRVEWRLLAYWNGASPDCIIVEWLCCSKRLIIVGWADLSDFFRWFSSENVSFFVSRPMKIVTFLRKNDYHPKNGLLIFLLKETHSETKSWKSSTILTKKNYNNNGKPWKSSVILCVNPFFHFSFFFSSFFFSFFRFFHFLSFSFIFFHFLCLCWVLKIWFFWASISLRFLLTVLMCKINFWNPSRVPLLGPLFPFFPHFFFSSVLSFFFLFYFSHFLFISSFFDFLMFFIFFFIFSEEKVSSFLFLLYFFQICFNCWH